MPTGSQWTSFIFVNVLFVVYVVAVYYAMSIQEIKDNWAVYRCNPMYLPLSDNMSTDFAYCIQNIQTGMMGNLLQPLTFITSSLANVMGSVSGELNSVREMFAKMRAFVSTITQSIFGVFLNLIIEFIRIIVGLRDMFGKTIGIMASLMYVMEGSILTMRSMWNGPSGQLVKALGKCFHPQTQVRLLDGSVKQMRHIDLGDVLPNGSIVESVMKIDNSREPEQLYTLPTAPLCQGGAAAILVTGSHSIYDRTAKRFVKVRDYPDASPTGEYLAWFSCLITSDHRIQIGEHTFWDWEDQLLYGI